MGWNEKSPCAHCSRTLAHIRISAHLTRMLTGMWTVLLLSVRMALPHYCQGGAVNGRIGAVNDVALTSPKGMATQRQAPASYGTRGTRGCYRIAIAPVAQPKNPPPFFLDFFSLSRRVRVDCHEPGSLAARRPCTSRSGHRVPDEGRNQTQSEAASDDQRGNQDGGYLGRIGGPLGWHSQRHSQRHSQHSQHLGRIGGPLGWLLVEVLVT